MNTSHKNWAFVTGASSGIGKEFARQLYAQGRNVILVARRKERLIELKKELLSQGSENRVEYLVLDLTSSDFLEKTKIFLSENSMTIDVLINNAGCGYYDTFTNSSWKEKEQTITLNSTSVAKLLHFFVPHMLDHKSESFVCNVGSLAGVIPIGHFSVYSATKAFLISLTEVLAAELKKTNVHVMSIWPGGVLTEFSDHANQELIKTSSLTMATTKSVVKSSLKSMFKGKRRHIPGLINKFSYWIFRNSPRSFAIDLSYKTMQKNAVKKPNLS